MPLLYSASSFNIIINIMIVGKTLIWSLLCHNLKAVVYKPDNANNTNECVGESTNTNIFILLVGQNYEEQIYCSTTFVRWKVLNIPKHSQWLLI